MSAVDAFDTSPRTSSVAGLMFENVPAAPSTSLPSMSIRVSCVTAISFVISGTNVLWAASTIRVRRDVGATVGLHRHPAVPPALEVWTGLAGLGIEAVRVVDLGLGVRVRTRDRGGGPGPANRCKADSVGEVRDVENAEDDDERRERRPGPRERKPLGQFFGTGSPGVVTIEKHRGRDHDEGDE